MKGSISIYTLGLVVLLCCPAAVAKSKVSSMPAQITACDSTDCSRTFQEYKTLARYGHSDAMYTLAELYRHGYGTEVDMRLATKWYRRSAKYGNPFAQYKAAIIYLQESETQDIEKAMRYLRAADREDLDEATHLLGLLYLEGELIGEDRVKAKEYLSRAFENGHKDTINALASISKIQLELPDRDITSEEALASQPAPVGEMEVIEVSAPSLEEVLTYHIATLRGTVPDAGGTTGSLLRGRTCSEMIACNTESDRERIREFLMSTW
ncbi:tetratricopeptide repeat protein [Shewanella atlantica]|uniref:tetratricopeptide repeat protein n=1 Tax=Shewanella atlantica TaxID=271099 RepID=UPI003734E589